MLLSHRNKIDDTGLKYYVSVSPIFVLQTTSQVYEVFSKTFEVR